MSTKRYKPEQVVNILRQIEVEIANGKTTPQACRQRAPSWYCRVNGLLPCDNPQENSEGQNQGKDAQHKAGAQLEMDSLQEGG